MNLTHRPRLRERGNTLLVTIVVTAIIGMVLAGYLTLVGNQNQLVVRSQVWNNAMPVTEAGVEEALTHCYWNFPTNMERNDWVGSGNEYRKVNPLSDGGLSGKGKKLGYLRHEY